MTTPSLHDIANMPFSQTAATLRKFYDPHWGKEVAEKGAYRVRFRWSLEGDFDDIVEATSPEEALQIAEDEVRDDVSCADGHFVTSCQKVIPA